MSVRPEEIEFQIIHTIPGRVHLKIPRLKRDPSYTYKLEQLVRSLDTVTNVNISSSSASMIVNYNHRSTESKIMQRKLIVCIWKADSKEAKSIESCLELFPEISKQKDSGIEVVSTAEQTADDLSTETKQITKIETAKEDLSKIDQFPINIDVEQKLFEIGIPASYILQPLNTELKKFETEHEKKTDLQQIKVHLEAFFREAGFLIYGRATGRFRDKIFTNPFTSKKYYTPWITITAVGAAELKATVVDETIHVELDNLNVSGEPGKWYKKLVEYAFDYLFKTKLIAKINDLLSTIEDAQIQQLFFKLKVDDKLRKYSHLFDLTSEKVDELLKLVKVNARVSRDFLWLSLHL